jgi:hypothetical protein
VRRLRLGFVCVASLALLSGCGVFGLGRLRAVRPTSVDALEGAIAERRAAVHSMRARVRLRSGLARVWTREAVLVQRPSSIRIDVLSPFGLALALGTEGRTLWAFPPQQGVRYEGPATPASFARLLGTPLAVGDLVDVLLGAAPARRPTLERDGEEYVLTVPFRGGTQTVRFATDTLAMTRVEEHRVDAPPLQVTFADYEDGFARALDLSGDGATASIAFDAIEPNVAIDPAVFEPPAATRVLPLDRAAAPG